MNNKVACTVGTKRCYFKWLHGYMAWLVVWNMTFIFPYIGNVIIPTHELHDFSEGLVETTNQWLHGYCQMSRSASLHHLLQQPGRLESTRTRNVAKLPHLVRLFSHQSLHLYSMISIYKIYRGFPLPRLITGGYTLRLLSLSRLQIPNLHSFATSSAGSTTFNPQSRDKIPLQIRERQV